MTERDFYLKLSNLQNYLISNNLDDIYDLLESTNVLNTEIKEFIVEDLRIKIGGFIVLDLNMDKPILYENNKIERKEKIYFRIPFQNTSEIPCQLFIDTSFVSERDHEYIKKGTRLPEFLKLFDWSEIHDYDLEYAKWHPFKSLTKTEQRYKQLIHCSTGEILFFLYAWRYLIYIYIQKGDIILNTFDDFFITEINDPIIKNIAEIDDWFDIISGFDFTKLSDEKVNFFNLEEKESYDKSKLLYVISENQQRKFIDNEWKLLGLKDSTHSEFSLIELLKYAEKITDYQINEENNFGLNNVNFLKKSPDSANNLKESFYDKFDHLEIDQQENNLNDKSFEDYESENVIEDDTSIENAFNFEDVHKNLVKLFYSLFEIDKTQKTVTELIKVLLKNSNFPILPYYFEYFFDINHSPKEHLVFPIWYSHLGDDLTFNNSLPRHTSFALLTYEPFVQSKKYARSDIDSININRIKILFNTINKSFVEKGFYQSVVIKEKDKQATRAAISQVMVRNMSHNIGSHVLNSIININPDYQHSRILFNYLKLRQEFLADISTTSAVISFPHYLYSEVLSRFYPKNNAEKVNSNYYKHLIRNKRYFENYSHYLINYISGKNNISENNIKIELNVLNETIDIQVDNNIRLVNNDCLIEFPNDILGFHAFYIIIEAIIRNACKHNQIGEELLLDFKLEESEFTHLYKVSIIDNLGKENINERSKSNFIDRLKKHIDSSILDEGKLRDEGWGILEMKICASYLIKYPLEYIDEIPDTNDIINLNGIKYPRLLSIFLDEYKNLGFSFYMMKPKLALIIDETTIDGKFNNFNNSNCLQIGLDTGFKTDWKSYGTDYQFVILLTSKQSIKNRIENYHKETNQRIINLKHLKLDKKEFYSIKELQVFLWKMMFIGIKNFKPIIIYDGSTNQKIDNNSCIFDHHAEFFNELVKLNEKKINPIYYEPFSGQSLTKTLYVDKLKHLLEKSEFSTLNNEESFDLQILQYELYEAVNCRILVIDERIQESCNVEENISQLEFYKRDILERMGIFIPPKQIDNYNISQNKECEKLYPIDLADSSFDNILLYNWIKHYLNNEIEYLVIHLGIIEKLIGSTDINKVKSWIIDRAWIKYYNINEEKIKNLKIIVTSGRGFPSNLPNGTFYVPISIIQQYTINYRSKIMLVKVLKSIRKIKKKQVI